MTKLKDILQEISVSGETIMNVDIQPEYENDVYFLYDWIEFLNENWESNDIVFLYNGPSLGMTSEQQYQMWLWEEGLEERILDTAYFYDKGYAFFRYCMDQGISDKQIVNLVKFMMSNGINDSREIDEQMWEEFVNQYGSENIRDLLQYADDMISIPGLMDELRRYDNITLTGGGVNECLKEVEIALKALDKSYNIINQFTY